MGIEGQGIYRVLIPETGQIIRSRNVVCKEGTRHHMLMDEGEYFIEDNGDVDYDFLGDETSLFINEISSKTANVTPPSAEKPKVSCQCITYPPAS